VQPTGTRESLDAAENLPKESRRQVALHQLARWSIGHGGWAAPPVLAEIPRRQRV